MNETTKQMNIAGQEFAIVGDAGYLAAMGGDFEPAIVTLYRAITEQDDRILDVGANIGLTAAVFSVLCPNGRIACIEPVPRTFEYLRRNSAGLSNVKLFNHALGSSVGELRMQGNPDFLAGSFVADAYNIPADNHFTEVVSVKTLDESFGSLGLDRLDFMKVDVEGFELEVFEGSREVLQEYKPLAFLEMNHWCLNIFRRTSIPDFRERLLKIFPYLYAIEGNTYIDFAAEGNTHRVYHDHLMHMKYCNLVAGFNRDEIVSKLGANGFVLA